MLDTSTRLIFDEEHEMFRDTVRKVFAKELVPNLDRYEREGIVDRRFWLACGAAGLLCPTIRPEYGGPGLDFRYNAIIAEELAYAGSSAGITVHNDMIVDYIQDYGSKEQRRKYLPGMLNGECIAAIAMTEPGSGSDLQSIQTSAVQDGDDYVINGTKTYISNGQNADLVVVAARTNRTPGAKGISLILVGTSRPGFARGRNLDKVGMHSADTSELFFSDVRVSKADILGSEGKGFTLLMSQLPQERLSIAISAQGCAQRAFDEAVSFVKQRKAFGKTVFDFQNTRFSLAEMKAQLQIGWAHLDWCIMRHLEGKLTTAEASAAKMWHTELQGRIVDAAVQLHGAAGYMNEYIISRFWRDARVSRIFGGTTEIMKEVIGRSI